MLHFIDGVAKVQEVLGKLNSCEGAEGQGPLLLQMVIQLGVLLQEKERILAPSRLPTADNCLGSLAKKDSSSRSACAGVSFTTQHCFSTALVIRLQTELYAYFHELQGIPAELWKNLVVVAPVHSTARGCISVTDSLRQAVAVVHAPVEDTLDGYCLLALLRKVFGDLAAQYSPGTSYSTSIISSASIRQHLHEPSDKFDFAVYDAEDVRSSVVTKGHLSTSQRDVDRAPLLLEWPVNHASLLSAQSFESIRESLGESDLPALATCLGLTSSSSSCVDSNHLRAAAALVHSWAVTDYHHTSTKLHQLLVKSPNAQRFAKICKVLRQHEELVSVMACCARPSLSVSLSVSLSLSLSLPVSLYFPPPLSAYVSLLMYASCFIILLNKTSVTYHYSMHNVFSAVYLSLISLSVVWMILTLGDVDIRAMFVACLYICYSPHCSWPPISQTYSGSVGCKPSSRSLPELFPRLFSQTPRRAFLRTASHTLIKPVSPLPLVKMMLVKLNVLNTPCVLPVC